MHLKRHGPPEPARPWRYHAAPRRSVWRNAASPVARAGVTLAVPRGIVRRMTAERPFAAVPGPDAERVSAIRTNFDPSRADLFEGFGETARDGLRTACRALIGDGRDEAGEAAARGLAEIRGAAAGLDPRVLTPRRGLAGLFDSRNRRLKRMRESFLAADRRLGALSDDLGARIATLKARAEGLEPRQDALRAPIVELGAWIEAGRQRLADVAGDAPEGEPAPRQRLTDRLERLAAARMAAIGQLPLARILQNVDVSSADRLESAARAVQAWRDDWRKALGIEGKKRRKVQPDPTALAQLTDRLNGALDRARSALEEGRNRRARVAERLEDLNRSLGEPPSGA